MPAIAAHNVLAKMLHAQPPTGVPAEQAMVGAPIMYYGGAVVEIAILVRWSAQQPVRR